MKYFGKVKTFGEIISLNEDQSHFRKYTKIVEIMYYRYFLFKNLTLTVKTYSYIGEDMSRSNFLKSLKVDKSRNTFQK